MSYKIKLSDGTTISGLGLSGNNFISTEPLTPEIFSGKLRKVEITYPAEGEIPEHTETYENMRLASIKDYGEKGYYFVLTEIPRGELEMMKLKSSIEYLALMSDIDIEE